MGTRSTIRFISKNGNQETPLVNVFQMWDGYVDGVGHELAHWLCSKKLVNGLSLDNDNHIANGVGDLAAQYIASFKEEPGDLYIHPLDYKGEYDYEVVIEDYFDLDKSGAPVNNRTQITVSTNWGDESNIIFKGTPEELLLFKEPDE